MTLPSNVLHPPFNITRISHVVLTSADLEATRRFYCDVLGFVVTGLEQDALYLRGLEEGGHHSLVFIKSDEGASCHRVGFRVMEDRDLDLAKQYLDFRKTDNHRTKRFLYAVFRNSAGAGVTLAIDLKKSKLLLLEGAESAEFQKVQGHD